MIIEVKIALFGYPAHPVVRVNHLALRAGRCTGIFGPNGSGKTTLVRGLVGLLQPMSGEVVRAEANDFGYLPQHRAMELHWPMSALDVACLALSARVRIGWVSWRAPRVREEMRALDVENLASKHFATLSGGQQQRVLLAGALAADPDALVLDEPTDGLDINSRRALLDRLRTATRQGLCTILVSHEPRDLLALADELVVVEPADEESEPSVVEVVDAAHFAQHVMGTHAR